MADLSFLSKPADTAYEALLEQEVSRLDCLPPKTRKLCAIPERSQISDWLTGQRVSLWVHHLVHDQALTRAGLYLRLNSLWDLLDLETQQVLRMWEVLHAQESPYDQDRLHRLREPRATVLLVLHTLEAWDPHGELLDWTVNFRDSAPPPESVQRFRTTVDECAARIEPTRTAKQYAQHLINVTVPAAQFCGLWDVRNALDNLAELLLDFERFRATVDWCHNTFAKTPDLREALQVIDGILPAIERHPTRWEWRHVASIIRQCQDESRCRTQGNTIWKIGFITIRCNSVDTCYPMLGALHTHRHIEHKNGSLKDFIGTQTTDGYQALHTDVVLIGPQGRRTASVRIVAPSRGQHSISSSMLAQPHETDRIRVYSPQGDYRDLPAGSNILNFAEATHQKFVGRVRYAILNGNDTDRVGVLHKLKHEDTVELVEEKEVTVPPAGWEEETPSATRIKRKLKSNLRPLFHQKGLIRLLNKLEGVLRENEMSTLREIYNSTPSIESWEWGHELSETDLLGRLLGFAVEDANTRLRSHPHLNPQDPKWWLDQLGLKAFEENGTTLPFRIQLDELGEQCLLSSVADLLTAVNRPTEEYDIPPELRKKSAKIIYCKECDPASALNVRATVTGSAIILHDASAPCAVDGQSITRHRHICFNHYFYIDSIDRNRLTREVLETLERYGIGIVEVIAKRLGPRWAVIRIETDFVSRGKAAQIISAIKALDDVNMAYGPYSDPPRLITQYLPPKRDNLVLSETLADPFATGESVKSDDRFYNRTRALATLHGVADLQRTRPQTGCKVLIEAPLKVGKTSLALKFLRDLEASEAHPVLTVRVKCPKLTGWQHTESLILAQLRQALSEYDRKWGFGSLVRKSGDEPGNLGLDDLLSAAWKASPRPLVVIVVDEALRPFTYANQKLSEAGSQVELDLLTAFCDAIDNAKNALLIWVGPSAPIRALVPELQALLRNSVRVLLTPFEFADGAALIRAEKMKDRYNIEVNEDIARCIHRRCGGNPYWISQLASNLWRLSGLKSGTRLKFTRREMKVAFKKILTCDELFMDRLAADPLDPNQIPADALRIMQLCARREMSPKDDSWVHFSEIQTALDCDAGESEVLEDLLKGLEATGSLLLNGENARISAPLLAEWICLRHPDTGRCSANPCGAVCPTSRFSKGPVIQGGK